MKLEINFRTDRVGFLVKNISKITMIIPKTAPAPIPIHGIRFSTVIHVQYNACCHRMLTRATKNNSSLTLCVSITELCNSFRCIQNTYIVWLQLQGSAVQ